jgi:hypothetical protein
MPEIDVSDIILDPFISGETFTVIRRAETVNNFGETTTTNTTFTASGSIQATGDNSLLREEAYQAQQKTIQVITTFLLRGATQDFLVRVVDDFSSYGSGMIRAECITQWFSDPAPRPGM